jgi:hypothetical protein
MEIQNMFLNMIWLSGFLVLCTGALWMLKVIWESVTFLGNNNGVQNAAESIIEEINELDLSVNPFSDGIPYETKEQI